MQRFLSQRLKLRQMRVVDAIATHRSLQRAAAALGLTQPALTKTLQELEDVLGARIFDRHARGTEPNALGVVVIAAARRMLAEAQRLEDDLDRVLQASAGSLAIGALPVAAAGILPAVLAALHERHPGIAVRLVQGTTDQLLPSLAAGELDLVVGRLYQPALPDSFVREAMYDEPMAILARADHPVLARAQVQPADLAGYQLVLPTITQRVGQDIERVLASLGLAEAVPAMRTSSVSLIREMLLTSDALTIIPRHVLAGDIARGLIAVVPAAFAAPQRPAGIIRAPGRPDSPSVNAFVECLREAIGAGGATSGHSEG